MWMRLAFALAIHVESDTLFVDEVLAVGDAAFQAKCFERFQTLKERGTTVLFVTHDLGRVRQLCHRALWLDAGHVRAFGASETITDQYVAMMASPLQQHAQR